MLINSLLFLGLLVLCFGAVLLSKKFFGKAGLFAWIAIASATSNIAAASTGPMLGLQGVTLANVPFATVFLSTQILSVCYGEKEGKKGVYVGLFSSVSFLLVMIGCSYLQQADPDAAAVTQSINTLFSLSSFGMCNTVASVLMFFLANMLDVVLFNKLNSKLKGKKLWISNNVAGILSNCLENFCFVFLGLFLFPLLVGLIPGTGLEPFDLKLCLNIALTTCACEIIIGLLDTPILYLARHLHKKNDTEELVEA